MSGIFSLAPSHHSRPAGLARRRRKSPMTAAIEPRMIQKFAVQIPLNCKSRRVIAGKLLAGLGEQAGQLRDEDEREDRHEQDAGGDHKGRINHGLNEAALEVMTSGPGCSGPSAGARRPANPMPRQPRPDGCRDHRNSARTAGTTPESVSPSRRRRRTRPALARRTGGVLLLLGHHRECACWTGRPASRRSAAKFLGK